MPLFGRDRYQRLDGAGGGPGRKPSSFCSSATVVVFVALCLVGAWMMASSNNIPVSVAPENKSEAKEEEADRSVDVTQSVKGGGGGADDVGGDTPRTGVEGADAGRKGDSGDDAPQTSDEAGSTVKKDDGGGEKTRIKGDEGYGDKTGDGDGATRTTDAGSDDVTRSDVAGETSGGTTGGGGEEETSKPAVGGAVAEGETASKNQTFSDENGKTEGGEVAKPEDPEKKVEQSSEDTGGVQADGDAKPEVTEDKDTGGDHADKSGQEASTTDTGGQADSAQGQDTPTDGGGGLLSKNQTTLDDANGKVEQDGSVVEKSSDEATSSDKEQTTEDDGTGAAAKNGTQSGDLSEAVAFAAADDTNGTIYQDAKSATTTNSSSSTQVTGDDGKTTAAEKAELLPNGQADLLNETASAAEAKSTFPTQAAASSEEKKKNKKKRKKKKSTGEETTMTAAHAWKLCNTSAGADYIPCLDNTAAIRKLKSTKHYEHRERHCPWPAPSCLVPLPSGYRRPIPWPHSRDKIWYHNVPHASLASYKGHQNWVKVSGEHLTFPGGGTQFKNGGAAHYADLMEQALSGGDGGEGEQEPLLTWGRRSRVVLDVGCGVASFGGALFDRDALTMSFAPKDEHEAQVQFALERGIPAVSAVMGTLRLPFPANVFDVVHCARCRVPWHIEGGKLLLEANRLLRPGGLFVWSATPVYRKVPEDVQIWHAMTALTKAMCWEMVKRTSDTVDQTAMVVFKKPTSNACYDARTSSEPPLCEAADDQDAAWNVTLWACMHRVPTAASARGARWPAQWPERLSATPYWLGEERTGVYGKPAPEDFAADQEHWRKVVENSYLHGVGIDWKNVRNVMDMRAVYGGFAAALRDMKVWVMNVVPVDAPDTLPIIYERGLFGIYHDWCESFSTYPRSYELLHADHLFSGLKARCGGGALLPALVEADRILRPGGTLIVRDDKGTVEEVRGVVESMHWEVTMTVATQGEEMLCARKTTWRPTEVEAPS